MLCILAFSLVHPQHHQPNSHYHIYHIPHRSAKSDLQEWLKQQSKSTKRNHQWCCPFFVIQVSQDGKSYHRHNPNELIVTVWHRSQTEQQEDCKGEFEVIHSSSSSSVLGLQYGQGSSPSSIAVSKSIQS